MGIRDREEEIVCPVERPAAKAEADMARGRAFRRLQGACEQRHVPTRAYATTQFDLSSARTAPGHLAYPSVRPSCPLLVSAANDSQIESAPTTTKEERESCGTAVPSTGVSLFDHPELAKAADVLSRWRPMRRSLHQHGHGRGWARFESVGRR
jgi:hypothetical protein